MSRSIDSVFRGLSRLDNSSQKPYFNEFSQFDYEVDPDESPESKQWVDIAISIDKVAKEIVSESFEIAENAALTVKSKNILSIAPDSSGSDIQIMLELMCEEDPSTSTTKEVEKIQ
jgi:hypothetical protein